MQTDDEIGRADDPMLADSDRVESVSPEEHAIIEKLTGDGAHKTHLTGMYRDWFLDYASYVILERAVPHIDDGFKPVQRRIMHSMRRLDDGRYNKVANIIGHTMQFHPHGDASIGDALVQLGQKSLLVDTQGNWGNILTGDGAAAPRYIEARLSKFALDVVFNPKTTEWMFSYDGRNQEPVTLPVKFPLLLAQGVEGIAVGLASKILPHNFNELIDAAIAHLRGQDFELLPDFPTGGLADCSRYNDGLRGGAVRVRARIQKIDRKTLSITELPYGRTTSSLIDTIVKANEKGKIKVKKIDDNTAANVEILIHLHQDANPDLTIDALYAFTDCEMSISPNACVIYDDKPHFVGVKEILRRSVERTQALLTRELQIRLDELEADWHYSSLEKIFFEQRIYRELERDVDTWETTLSNIEKQLEPYAHLLRRPITRDDVVKLTEKPVRKISKFDIKKADEYIKSLEAEIDEVQNHLAHIVDYVIAYYQQVKKKHGKGRERRTELRSFDNIEAAKVVVANEKLYIDRAEGFVGTALKGDGVELVSPCSNIDDVIVFLKDGRFFVKKVQEKDFVGKDIIHAAVYTKNDTNTVYNVLYRDGLNGCIMMKRCNITGTTRDREYNITKGTPRSEILFFSANPNGETDILKVFLKPRPRLRNLILELNFADIAIKGRGAAGNIFTRFAIHKLQAKEKVAQTAGQKVWFDADVLRLNTEGAGTLVGEFAPNAMVLTIMRNGSYHLTGQPFSARFDELPMRIEPFDPDRIFTAIYRDEAQKLYYLKRFRFEPSNRDQTILPEGERLTLVGLSPELYPSVLMVSTDKLGKKQTETLDADAFIAVKGVRAKGKRLANHDLRTVMFGDPLQKERSAFADEATATAQPEAEVQPANEPDAPQGLNLEFDS